ncbi:MAG: GNAT family N-acetyltransferase [Gemmataceae bacterium]|nr:GNAT family N-acetyltransferase [Gemmataceae bacterium]
MHLAKDFSCSGPSAAEPEWEKDVRVWITAPRGKGGAIDSVEMFGDSVWTYLDEEGGLVGYCSLGLDRDTPPGQAQPQILPYLGLRIAARGKKLGPRLQWVIEEARRRHVEGGALETLLLYADPNNTKAIALYRDAFGFADVGEVATDPRKLAHHDPLAGVALTPPTPAASPASRGLPASSCRRSIRARRPRRAGAAA